MLILLVYFERSNVDLIEVIGEDPYLAVVHAGDIPAVINFPRQTSLQLAANIQDPTKPRNPGVYTRANEAAK